MISDPYIAVSMIYDHMMHRLSYKDWANYIVDIKTYYKDNAEKFLEIACGTGKLNSFLEKSFNDIVLLDISKSMLDCIPSDRKRVCADMSLQPFKTDFDFIYSTFDSINYITDEEEIVRYMREVWNILSDNGIFTFDASLENNSIKNVKRLNRTKRFKGIEYKQVSNYDKDLRIHQNSFTIKLANGEIIEEVHTQKIYDFEFYFDAAERAGLYVLDCFDAFTFEDAGKESERIQFIMKKR